jgi:pyruvate/2-oxoacid:ferredoxin oxidoreductase alpha subunit
MSKDYIAKEAYDMAKEAYHMAKEAYRAPVHVLHTEAL